MLKKSIFVLLVSVLAYKYYQSSIVEDVPIVRTGNGEVKGKVSISREGRRFFEYLGIPYAKPPIGVLRYENPVPAEKWNGVRLAQRYGPECAQVNFISGVRSTDEDCLFLNVATPTVEKGAKLPVIAFIHGGLFICGSSNGMGAHYLVDEDVILVSMNYRLASLGFLNTGDGLIAGNMGLKDQVLALRWIQDNIENFGGDKDRVTIVGESAGSASVNYHMLSPLSKGLFYRAISQSGSVLNSWALGHKPGVQAKRHGNQLKCPTSNSKAMVDCLKGLPISTILDVHEETTNIFRDMAALFLPSVETVKEGAMIPALPYDLIRAGPISAVPWMSGYNADEGQCFFAFLGKNESGTAYMEQHFEKELPKLMLYANGDEGHRNLLVQKMIKFYFKTSKPAGLQSMGIYSKMFTDGLFAYGISEAMKLHSEFQPVFPYYYNYHGDSQIANLVIALKGKYPLILEVLYHMAETWVNRNIFGREPLLKGASHGDELMLLFQMGHLGSVIQPGNKDYEMSRNLVKLWASFAKGDKQLGMKGKRLMQLEKNAKEVNYLKLDETPEIIPEPNINRLKFWKANSLLH